MVKLKIAEYITFSLLGICITISAISAVRFFWLNHLEKGITFVFLGLGGALFCYVYYKIIPEEIEWVPWVPFRHTPPSISDTHDWMREGF